MTTTHPHHFHHPHPHQTESQFAVGYRRGVLLEIDVEGCCAMKTYRCTITDDKPVRLTTTITACHNPFVCYMSGGLCFCWSCFKAHFVPSLAEKDPDHGTATHINCLLERRYGNLMRILNEHTGCKDVSNIILEFAERDRLQLGLEPVPE